MRLLMIMIGLSVCFAPMLSGCCKLGEKAAGSSGQEEKAATPTAVVTPPKPRVERPSLRVQAKELLAEYGDNEVRADGKFKGKLITVAGVAGDIKKDIADGIYVTVGTGAMLEIPVLQCFAAKGQEAAFAALSKGQKITVETRIDGLMMNVLGKDCILNPTAKLCEQLRAAAGEGACEDSNGDAMLMIGGTGIAPLCVSADRYDKAAVKDWGKARFVGSKANGCFFLMEHIDPKKAAISAEVTAKLTAALDTL